MGLAWLGLWVVLIIIGVVYLPVNPNQVILTECSLMAQILMVRLGWVTGNWVRGAA